MKALEDRFEIKGNTSLKVVFRH